MLLTGWLTQLQNRVNLGRGSKRRRRQSLRHEAPEVLELRTLLSATGADDALNAAPTAVADAMNADAGVPVTVDVLANDVDPDGDFLTVSAVGVADHGSVEIRPSDSGLWDYYNFDQQYAGQYGEAQPFADWYADAFSDDAANLPYVAVYTPDAGFSGTDTFTYTVSDTSNLQSTATVTVNVAATSGPVFSESQYTFEVPVDSTDGTVVGSVSASADSGDAVSFAQQGNSAFSVTDSGEVVLDFAYELQYIGVGSSQSFDIIASDGSHDSIANVTISVVAGSTVDDGVPPVVDQPDDYQDEVDQLYEEGNYTGEDYYDLLEDSPVADYVEPFEEEIVGGHEQAADAAEEAQEEASDEEPANDPVEDNFEYEYDAEYDAEYESEYEYSNGDNSEATSGEGGETDDELATNNTGGETDLRFDWTPFQFPENVSFPDDQLPGEAAVDDLMLLQPTGTDTFETTTSVVSDSIIEPIDPQLGQGTKTTDVSSQTTLQQEYTSPTEWTITQSVTNSFSATDEYEAAAEEEPAVEGVAADGSDGDDTAAIPASDGDDVVVAGDNENSEEGGDEFDRSGSSTHTIEVINGTKTVVTYSVTDTFLFEAGDLPGATQDDDGNWVIPDSWQDAATDSDEDEENAEPGDGNEQPIDSDETADDTDDSNSTADDEADDVWNAIFGVQNSTAAAPNATAPASNAAALSTEDTDSTDDDDNNSSTSGGTVTVGGTASTGPNGSSGSMYLATSTYTASITTEAITMPDGSAGTTTTFSFSTSFFFISMAAGSLSYSSDDDAAKTNAGGGSAATEENDGNSVSITASMKYMKYSTASSTFSIDVSSTSEDGTCGCGAEVSASLSIDLSSSGGNLETFKLDASKESASGDAASGNGSSNSTEITMTEITGGSNHFSLGINLSSGDDSDDSGANATTQNTAPASGAAAENSEDDDSDNSITLEFGNSSFSTNYGKVTMENSARSISNIAGEAAEWETKGSGFASSSSSESSSTSYSSGTFTASESSNTTQSSGREDSEKEFREINEAGYDEGYGDFINGSHWELRTEHVETFESSATINSESSVTADADGTTPTNKLTVNVSGKKTIIVKDEEKNAEVDEFGAYVNVDEDLFDSESSDEVSIAGDRTQGFTLTKTSSNRSTHTRVHDGVRTTSVHEPAPIITSAPVDIDSSSEDEDVQNSDDPDVSDDDEDWIPVALQADEGEKDDDGVVFTGDPADVKEMEAIWARICKAAGDNRKLKTWLNLIAKSKKPIILKVIRQEDRDGQPLIHFGSFADEMLDLNDFEKVPKSGIGLNQERILLHEVAEQFFKQSWHEGDYEKAHAAALEAESTIDGWLRKEDIKVANGQKLNVIIFSHPKYKRVYQQLWLSIPRTGDVMLSKPRPQ